MIGATADAKEALDRANAVYDACHRALADAADAARAAHDAYTDALRREARAAYWSALT